MEVSIRNSDRLLQHALLLIEGIRSIVLNAMSAQKTAISQTDFNTTLVEATKY